MAEYLLVEGTVVRAADGARLGTIKEVSGPFFKVGAMLRRAYWLHRADVNRIDRLNDVVWLSFPKIDLEDYKMEVPDYGWPAA